MKSCKKTLASVSVLPVSNLYHVGTLNPKGAREASYEGQGLSVSTTPDAWVTIARLGGNPWHKASVVGYFVDFYALTDSQLDAIYADCVHAGWITPVTLYEVSWWDDEFESEMTSVFSSYDEAADEGIDNITTRQGFLYTQDFPDVTVKNREVASADIVVAAWTNTHLPEVDGVWWDERLDVIRLSAPRGVISVNKVQWWLTKLQPMEV